MIAARIMVHALVSDLFFRAKIEAVAAALGISVACLPEDSLLESGPAGLYLIDLTATETAPELVGELKRAAPAAQVIAFYPHVRVDLAQRARAAGADRILPRSEFSRRLPDILKAASTAESPSRRDGAD